MYSIRFNAAVMFRTRHMVRQSAFISRLYFGAVPLMIASGGLIGAVIWRSLPRAAVGDCCWKMRALRLLF